MNLFLNKKISGPLVFGLIGLLVILLFYFVGSKYTTNKRQQEVLEALNQFTTNSGLNGRNLTQDLASNIVTEVAKTNLANAGIGSVKVPDSSVLGDTITATINNFNPESLKPIIKTSDLKVTSGNSSSALATYFKNFQLILNEYSQALSGVNNDTTVGNALAVTATAYEKMISDLFALPVPKDVASFHKEEIALLSAKLTVVRQLERFTDDPLLTLLALQSDRYFDDQFEKLKNEINEYLVANNVNF